MVALQDRAYSSSPGNLERQFDSRPGVGTEVKDPSVLDPKIVAFNTDGTTLGAIKMGAGSQRQQRLA
jgi:hypothetical protein